MTRRTARALGAATGLARGTAGCTCSSAPRTPSARAASADLDQARPGVRQDIYLAVSDDLVAWDPVLKEEKTGKRLGALLGKGQYEVLFDAPRGDAGLRAGEYTVGEVLFDRLDPSAVIARCERYFLRAERRNEVSGQMENTRTPASTSRHTHGGDRLGVSNRRRRGFSVGTASSAAVNRR